MGLLDNFRSLLKGTNKVNVSERFTLLREAISGTMSKFYMAQDKVSGQIVGLKILDVPKTLQFEARFQGLRKPTEGEIGRKIVHPLVVKTLEYGLTTNNEQYVVLEFLDGPGLNSLIVSRSPQLAGRRMPLIRQAAEALAAVHEAGYIHRDVCPRNFVVSRDLATLKLIDFGLTVPATAAFMQPGNRTGTANYMAPEVVRRRATDKRLDIFAFGVTVYELCAFEFPWPRGTTGQAAMAHGVDESADIRTFCPKIHPKLATAISACLEASPEKRPESMEAVLQSIKGVDRETVD